MKIKYIHSVPNSEITMPNLKMYIVCRAHGPLKNAGSWQILRNSLTKQMQLKNSFTGFVSPEEYHALQARFNQDIKSAGEKVNSLANEKLLLQKSLADLESSSKMAYAALENKVNELQDQVQIAFNEKKNLEVKFERDLQAKSNEIIKLQSQLDGALWSR